MNKSSFLFSFAMITLCLFAFSISAEVVDLSGKGLNNLVRYSKKYGCLVKSGGGSFGVFRKTVRLDGIRIRLLSRRDYKNRLRKLRIRKRISKNKDFVRRVVKLRKAILKLRNSYRTCIKTDYISPRHPPPTATAITTPEVINRAPVASYSSVEVSENSKAYFELKAEDGDGDPLSFDVVEFPRNGTFQIIGSSIQYQPNFHYLGGDTLTFRVNDGLLDSNLATVTITVVSKEHEFAGDPYSIRPYREQLTENEVRNVLKKLGDGNTTLFLDAALQGGLEEFVDELISYEHVQKVRILPTADRS